MNRLYFGDNLRILRRDIREETVDLIYLDPPFNSKRSYNVLFATNAGQDAPAQIQAFDDTWHWSQESEGVYDDIVEGGATGPVINAIVAMRRLLGENDVLAYLVMMTARLLELHRVLKPTGTLFLHCDPTASHYLKIILDAIFGPAQFRNEIIWRRTPFKGSSKARAQQLPKSHDVIFFYSKGDEWTWAAPTQPYSDKYLARFKWDDGDGRGPYRKTLLKTYSEATAERLKAENRWIDPVKAGAMPSYKQYLEESSGTSQLDDVWTDINMINPQAAERLGYPTQKPLALLDRIIEMATVPGQVVLDPFCGCGTTIDSAQRLGRRWIGIDITYLAISEVQGRLRRTYGEEIDGTYTLDGVPRDMEAAQALFNENPFDFERWAVRLVGGHSNERQVGDHGIDGVAWFYLNEHKDLGEVLISVKGGRQLNPAMVRDLRGTVERENAALGLFVCLSNPTRGMLEEADKSGSYTYEFSGARYPRLQIITISDLLAGKRPNMPTPVEMTRRAKRSSGQLSILDD